LFQHFDTSRAVSVALYRRLGDEIRAAAREYAEEVRQGRFPAAEHTYSRQRGILGSRQ
jgi:ketopantoate hydroxymethyltransferase